MPWPTPPRRSCPTRPRPAGVRVVATGRSDFPNQINNVLGLPGPLPGRAGRPRPRHQRRDEAGRRLAPSPDLIHRR
ncbi:MAG: hypothetical protein ACLVJH_01355 [Faecalibacterium prausnitzii]